MDTNVLGQFEDNSWSTIHQKWINIMLTGSGLLARSLAEIGGYPGMVREKYIEEVDTE